jgi:glycosyltransferase involved in cell wall biosynthesis
VTREHEEGEFVVGMLGRVTYQKDPETFLRAAALLHSSIPGARFVWVGDGDLREETMRTAHRLGLSSKLIITGQRDSKDIPALLSAMDVLLFTSRFEGLPTALLEAMAARKIIVAADVGSIRDVITDGVTGWLFPPGDFQHAASIVERIYRNRSGLDHIGNNARDLIVTKYAPQEKTARNFQRVYEDVLSRG